jgi:hypothetical protein
LIEPPGEKGAAKAPAVNLPGAFSIPAGAFGAEAVTE